MISPDKIRLEVFNAVGLQIPRATVKLVVRRGTEWREEKSEATSPVTHALRSGFIVVEVDATAPDYVSERGIITFGVSTIRWECTNPAWSIREEQETAILHIVLGRIRFAPIVELPGDLQVRTPFNPGGVLVTGNAYRTIALNAETTFRTIRQPATGKPDDPGWDRFMWDEQRVNLTERGNWLILEYGDPSIRPEALRHLIGVWAPHSFPGTTPPVVVQITPNTRKPYYPADSFPFTGMYP